MLHMQFHTVYMVLSQICISAVHEVIIKTEWDVAIYRL